ncbi:MAG TPA: phosphoglycerate dehydrogenase [Dehalococcoidia bacterium]|nr:phosphoglycerate dehydrogenase [Dehalococcoidia bacterium]
MARVLVTEPIATDGIEALRREADVDVRLGLTPEQLIDAVPGYQALIVRSETKVTAAVLDAARELLVVGRAGSGVDNIEVEPATRRGVVVVNAPEGNTIAATEHTIGLMLALARHIPSAQESLRSGSWQRSKFLGVELRGKTLGIVGLGRVGSEVARRARGLEMRVIALEPFQSPERAQAIGVTLVSKEELLRESDFITLHAPLTPGSRNIIGEDELKLVKPDVRIINVARGGLVSEAALFAALEAGRVAGAALDVFESEPPPNDLPLLRHPKVIVTPHLGASTAEAQERVAVDVAEQVLAVLRGEPAMYAVNAPFIPGETFKVISPYLQAATQAGSLATQLVSGQLDSVEIEYLGELADHDVSPLKSAVIRGLLSPVTDENVTLVNAGIVAEQRGLRITERKAAYDGIYKDLIRVNLQTSAGRTSISTTVAHDGPHIVEINDFWVDISAGEGYLLLVENVDQPGMIGRIGSLLGEKGINISFMRVGREKIQGRALMVLGLDDDLDAGTLGAIAAIPNIFSARTAHL